MNKNLIFIHGGKSLNHDTQPKWVTLGKLLDLSEVQFS